MVIDKIGNVNNIYDTKKAKNVQKSADSSAANDLVEISNEGLKAVEEARYTQIVREASDVRAERVREIKAQIDAGTYDKDMDDKVISLVADKILSGMLRR